MASSLYNFKYGYDFGVHFFHMMDKDAKEMIFKLIGQSQQTTGTRISTRCPHCGHNGTFEAVGSDINNSNKTFGIRRCPNGKCFGHLFFVYNNQNNEIILTHPSDTIPFDKDAAAQREKMLAGTG